MTTLNRWILRAHLAWPDPRSVNPVPNSMVVDLFPGSPQEQPQSLRDPHVWRAEPRQTKCRHPLALLPGEHQCPPDTVERVSLDNPTAVAFVNRLS